MTIIHTPGSLPTDSIALQTRQKRDIPNVQAFDLSILNRKQAKDIKDKYSGPGVIFVNGPSPLYNCHGLVFASRRTCITDLNQIPRILKDDGFVEVRSKPLFPGDIILYYEEGEVSHSGIVVRIVNESPFVWSKWGKGHEVVHMYSQCPYRSESVRYFRMKNYENHD